MRGAILDAEGWMLWEGVYVDTRGSDILARRDGL
jgi:hypothetical protein